MLKGHFYHITSTAQHDNVITAALHFDSAHPIFSGHFPGQPVVPGACMLQMVKEILTDSLQHNYRLKKADHLKFMAPVDPRVAEDLELKLTHKTFECGLQITASLSANGVICFKMQGVWV